MEQYGVIWVQDDETRTVDYYAVIDLDTQEEVATFADRQEAQVHCANLNAATEQHIPRYLAADAHYTPPAGRYALYETYYGSGRVSRIIAEGTYEELRAIVEHHSDILPYASGDYGIRLADEVPWSDPER